jgi:hypothetical protein
VLLVDGGSQALVSAVLGGSSAGFRLVAAQLADADDDSGIVELLPPNAALPPGPRTRANVPLPPVPGGAGDPDLVPGPGLFAAPERFDQRPFSPLEAARKVSETAVEMLKARGEPARYERLLAEILVGLDRGGMLRRYTTTPSSDGEESGADATSDETREPETSSTGSSGDPLEDASTVHVTERAEWTASVTQGVVRTAPDETADPVERLLVLIDGELTRPTQHRLLEIEPGRWWLGDRADREAAAAPLADRVEWSVFSLLSTAGPLPESAFFERIAAMFTGHDLADEALVRACLDSYRSRASTPERIVTSDDLLRRSQEHTELLAALTEGGHRLGMQVWLGQREQTRRIDRASLGDLLDERERDGSLAWLSRTEELLDVDCIWYVRGKAAFLFEVEWTAMLGEPLLRRHARIASDDRIVRFLVIAPERTELVRYKLARSPLLRSALDDGPWHVLKSDHLRRFLERDELDLEALEPLLGLDPSVERGGEQLPLFEG